MKRRRSSRSKSVTSCLIVHATDPITDKKLTKTVSHSYRKGTFTQATYEQIAQLKDKGVQHTMQKVNERELE